MSDNFSKQLGMRWQHILRGITSEVVWSYRLSPPLPSSFPPNPAGQLFFYAFAYGTDLSGGLIDAVRVSAPWARVEKSLQDDTTHVTFFATTLIDIGVQGMRPLTGAEVARLQMPIEKSLRALAQSLDDDGLNADVRAFYRAWMRDHGVIANAIQQWHTTFFHWLNQNGSQT